MRIRPKRLLLYAVAALAVVFVAIQLVPFGRPTENPPTRREPNWNSPQTRELVARACMDCHSNQTRYPWYSYVAPVSWLVNKDITEARSKLNFSEWDGVQRGASEAVDAVKKGEMPLPIYLPLHPEAKLSADEVRILIEGLDATIAGDRPRRR